MNVYLVNGLPRRIGVTEAKQLMGFPRSFVFPVSKTQAIKQLGNTVALKVISLVLKSLVSVDYK